MSPDTGTRPRSTSDEEGVALVFAMFAVILLAGLAVLFVGHATSSSRQSGIERHRENSVHAAEAAADTVVANVNAPNVPGQNQGEAYLTPTTQPAPVSGTEAEQRQWAIDEAIAAAISDPSVLVTTGFGQGYAVRPDNPDLSGTQPLDTIWAVGFSPSFDAATSNPPARNSRIRVIKMQINTGFGSPNDAILTCGDLLLGGNAATQGIAGNVYVNGDVYQTGSNNAWQIDGDLAATGTIDSSVDDNVTGTVTRNAPPKPCADFSAQGYYFREQDPVTNAPGGANPDRTEPSVYGSDSQGRPIYWYDLCPPGEDGIAQASIRVPDPVNGPCYYDASATAGQPGFVEWRKGLTGDSKGWDYQNGEWVGNSVQPGIFYIYHANARIQGGNGGVTLILEATHTTDPDGRVIGDSNGGANGNLKIRGNPTFEAAYQDVQFVVERDFEMRGTAGTELNGAILIWEQFLAPGNATMNGTIVAQERDSTLNSPIADGGSYVTGSMSITNNRDIRVPVHDLTRVTFWNELSP